MEGSPAAAAAVAVTPTTAPSTPSLSPRDRTKTPPFLSNLGKPTLRGIRKCPQCGVYNGTRGLSCKNQRCGAVFRDGAGRSSSNRRQQQQPQPSAEAVRVVTGSDPGSSSSSSPRLYSVRQRDRGPDYRGFVELGVDEAEIRTPGGGALLTQVSSGRCYVPACCRAATTTTGAAPESPCLHVKLATECRLEASPLTLKSSVLGSLQASQEAKQAIWQLATESSGPLVQRITRSIMVVKCKASELHPLGYLHASFSERGRGREGSRGPPEMRFQCSCQQAARGGAAGPRRGEEGGTAGRRCVHFYACLCAFASDHKLQQEFSGFINGDADGLPINPESLLLYPSAASPHSEPCVPAKSKKIKGEGATAVSIPLITVRDGGSAGLRRPAPRKQVVSSALKRAGSNVPVDEAHVTLSFHQWLASVTERIHQTMHFQFDGKPEPLVFHIPQSFFEALQQRISAGNKKRLPNSTTAFVRRDALPLGSFSKYSWHVHNILQVKQIFDTPEVPLEVTQSFVKNSDGSFELFRCPPVRMEPVGDAVSGRSDRQPAIRPLELKTFLRVGNTAPDQKEPTPFIIEWIPDILPRSKVGELRLRFEYGHLHNGHVENTEQPSGPEQGLGLCPSDTSTH
ncbi:uncharacterized protein C2orf42 [Acipenser ruthenus]|uniref:uncharacterized protein C2orf42 n=1 Tax=Acipenser ruthenus TaxID=7906 RepID=UPI002740D43C|nr:uncharacterized protein C2orf42 [Acipenser ruthenus]